MRYVIVTGTSQGLGEAIATQLLEENTRLICISRRQNEKLIEKAKQKDIPLTFHSIDLQDVHNLETHFETIFSSIEKENVSSIHLINNAGTLAPMKPIEKSESELLIANVQINLIAPMILTSSFMKHTKNWNVDKRIINISSGAGQKPYFGWGAYCTTKAGVNMFTQCVAIEEAEKEYPVKTIAFAPGVVDTNMQQQIRQTEKEDFTNLDRFIALKEEGKLLSPEYVAKAVIHLLDTPHFESGGVIRIDEK
ncbi:short-chain dehydrogenase [Bacillus pseudomycoides]|uniref:(S)-benzoin forming benzil reductase n=1 Tax=Bacillus TaxID=1386 RepID=UPI000BEBC675|nr:MULTISPECIES: (S)-benzoin forming benzil reductase [Bacillus]MCX2827890.1 (S)-benzoin forming benzil reductase [Bacillus sp. DHT2]MDR4916006.1 (S)-benzoin forming benzil reductase [Bacillus pseudomycoides]MED4651004.1 (S)-benzoin forming benzil reductase [Bacillus pseudomycoides]PDX97265.1 short-chain dehydrogenase [Bacillus pseudomycoides]PEE03814.1 short-chain dehydrogenase [Bacillus pseudomycoides]